MKMPHQKNDTLATNKKAHHEYFVTDTFEAGMVLTGTEIKSVRAGKIQIVDGYIQIKNGEAILLNVHIAPFLQGNRFNVDPLRPRKLLLHRQEINKLIKETQANGLTIVPLKVYVKHGYAKILIGIAKGKHDYDKRHDLKKREQDREIARVLKHR